MVVAEKDRKIAVVGVGGWGKNHARVLHDMGALTAICDTDESKSIALAKLYNANHYSSLDKMLEREPSLEAAVICTPTKTHFNLAKKIMEKKLHVFVEKPLAFSSSECEHMIEIARKMSVILTSGYIERFNPAIQNVKQIIDAGKYGDLIMMEFHRENRMPLHIQDVGIIYDTSVHDIDTAMYLFDSTPQVVFARSGTKFHSYEDFATIMLGFDGQRVAIIASNWITPNRVRKFSAVCTEGIIEGDYITQGVKIDHGKATIIPRPDKFQEPLTLEIQSFLDVISGRTLKLVVTPEDATNVTKVAEAALLSARTGSPIYMDLKSN
ncbi:Gfo/Idh/MocA family protein [Nitrososphaera sp. AFS]|jgi:UDP-N-acetylglucosamine 3-dehydrogenase|uniref:Gfo/Idh/MocA family protein n=1 Tax=Nitrososphaera sp. AFS TaxID=2301191 RepID=UPI0013924356|nr:Gfo/Idh/MocA family oxidoreductase [Nitrososphaera sp. AFS]NAL76714.1 gfo/Idh/MocA family oxidoreductase [Nitrososphaera sp. AFS]